MELFNIDKNVKGEILKLQSVQLCSSTIGQLSVDLLVKPPSYPDCSKEIVEKHEKEQLCLLESLKKRAKIVTSYLKKMTNIEPNEV